MLRRTICVVQHLSRESNIRWMCNVNVKCWTASGLRGEQSRMTNDPMAPRSAARSGMGGPLRMVTLVTTDPQACRRLYVDVLQMQELQSHDSADENGRTQTQQAQLWGLCSGARWTTALYHRPELPEVPLLRVLHFETAGPLVRPHMNALLEGGLSVGFAMRDMPLAVERARLLGFNTTAGIARLAMTRADGSPYEALECHFKAPDDVYALGVGRPADLAPVGAIEAGLNVGGPSYSAQVANHADRVLEFYTGVLDYEIRRDVMVSGPGPERGLGLPPGTQMRFLQVFAQGAASGYLVFLDFADQGSTNPTALGPPSRGVTMWSFPVRDLDVALDRVRSRGLTVVAIPCELDATPFGRHRVASVRTPNGFLVELLDLSTFPSPQLPDGS